MNRTIHTFLIVMMLCTCVTAYSAKRAVFFEHFSQELCLTCPATADAIDQFRSDFGYEDVVIISYWVQGSQAIPEGNNRGLLFLDEVITPSVIVDGVINIPNPPQDYASLVDSYNTRRNEPSPCLMSVIQKDSNQYTIKIDAEQAFSGYLVVVAYSYFTHDGHNYPCFAREFLTPYTGEAVSAGPGDTLLIDKTVSYSGHDGVVAWLHDESKMIDGGRRFTPWSVLQSADSHAGGTMPTATPECTATPTQGTPTPTPTHGTPTATPEIPCDELGVTISMPDTFFHGGDLFFLDAYICNDQDTPYSVPLFVILDVYGQLFFAPSFSKFDKYDITLPPNDQILQTVLDPFFWPHGAGEAQNIHFHAAMTDQEITHLFGEMDSVTFGWTN